jgi:cytochrome b
MVWDLPTRLFHWGFVISIIGAYVSGENGLTTAHEYFGLAALGLLVFRFIWGFIGHETARFATLVKPLSEIVAYAGSIVKRRAAHYAGHNPLGGLSIIAMLLVMGAMALTGLWTGDDVLYEAPLTVLNIMPEWAQQAGAWHESLHIVIIPLVALHLLAIMLHRLLLGEKLVSRMITGRDFHTANAARAPNPRRTKFGLALLALCVCAALSLAQVTPSY